MCLTESQCGTDLGMLKTRAEPRDDGSFALTGTKIFISAGEHDVSENILHLVLARLPDAPAGTRGISLFLVPKFLPDANGEVGERNAHQGRLDRAQDGHPRQRHLRDEPGRRARLADRRAEQGPGGDVRDDEFRATGRRHAVARPGRSGAAERAWPTHATASRGVRRPASSSRTSRPTRSSCIPTCGACCSPARPTPKAAAR